VLVITVGTDTRCNNTYRTTLARYMHSKNWDCKSLAVNSGYCLTAPKLSNERLSPSLDAKRKRPRLENNKSDCWAGSDRIGKYSGCWQTCEKLYLTTEIKNLPYNFLLFGKFPKKFTLQLSQKFFGFRLRAKVYL